MRRKSPPSLAWFAAAALCAAAAVIVVLQYRSDLRRARAETLRRLDALAGQQAQMIANWIEDGFIDLRACRALGRSNTEMMAVYRAVGRRTSYIWIQHVDRSGRRLAGGPRVALPRTPADARAVAAALSRPEGTVVFGWEDVKSRPFVDLSMPDGSVGPDAGALILRMDPRVDLFRALRSAHAFSATAESLIVRRNDDEVEFLSDRRRPGLSPRLPVSSPNLAAAKALRGEKLDGSEVDYSGRRVLAVVRPVAGADWILVAKVAADEIIAPILHQALLRGLILIGLVLLAAAAFLRLYRRQEALHAEREFSSQREIIEKTRLLDAFFRHSLTPIVFLDRDFNFVRVNEAYAKACGKRTADFPGRNHFEFYPHAENEGIFRQVVRTKIPHRADAKLFEFPDQPERGATYWNWTLVPLLDSAGEVDTLVFSLEDVTARVQAESDLKRHAAELDDLYNKAPCGYHSLGEDGTFLLVNDTELEWLGYGREEIVGRKKFTDLLTPGSLKTFLDAFPGFKERGRARDLEFDMVRKDGSILPVLLSATAVKDELGRFVMSRSTVYDMTDRKRADEARARLAAMVEGSDDAIISKSLDGVITSWNEGAHKVYGWTAAEAVGENVSVMVPPGEADPIPEILAQIRRGEHVAPFETNRRCKDGRVIRVSLTLSPVKDQAGAVVGASAVARDVTSRWEAEREVARLSRSMRTLSLCNEALVRANEESELLERVCRLVVEQGGYHLAWIGYRVEDAAKSVKLAAQAGCEEGYLEGAHITWADEARGGGPTGTAIRNGTVEICRDVRTDPRMAPWREDALKRGYLSSVALPLRSHGRIFGALMIYSAEANAFNDEEIALLKELSDDLSYGIAALRERDARALSEEALRTANAYNRSLIEVSLDPLVTIGADGRITDVNLALLAATGRSRGEVIATAFSAHFTRPQEAQAGYEKVLREGHVRDYPLEILARDGRVTPVLFNATVYRDEKGRVLGVFAAARDSTERLRLEKEREQFFKFFQTATDLMCMADPNGAFIRTNPAFAQTLGYTDAELRSKPFVEFVVPDDKQATLDEMARQLKKGFTFNFENRYACKDGSIRILSWRAVYNKEDGVTYATARDMTEQKRAEAALHRTEVRYRRLFESASDGILVVDSESEKIVDVNSAMLVLFGYSQEECAGRCLWDFEPFKAAAAAQPTLREQIARGKSRHEDLTMRAKDGRRIVVELTINLYTVNGGVILQYSVRDISERKRLQAQILHAQKMESVGLLAGGVAHDLNNILMVILGNASFLLSSLGAKDPRRADVVEIQMAEERAAALTRQLLIFSRKQPVQPVVLDFNELIANLQKMLGRIIGEDIKLELALWPQPVLVRADPGQLEQVIVNLVVNARDAMPRGGRLSLRTFRPETGEACHPDCAAAGAGRCVRLEVSDTGTGMAPEVLSHLFEPFFTTKPAGRGTGLGLATAYGIVRQSGGGIGVHSAPGQGTTFILDFPLVPGEAAAAAAPAAAQAPAPESRGCETILLVEDDEILRRIDVRLLQDRGYRVLPARDGEEALSLLHDGGKDADLLLTDVVMPGIGGGELAREARRLKPGLKVIFVSGYVDHRELEQLMETKSEFLQKPVAPEVLARKVREILDRPAPAASL